MLDIYVAAVQNVKRTIFFLLRSISPIHRGMETHIYITKKRSGKLRSPALFASKNVILAKKKILLMNESPNDFHIGRLFLLRHTGVQKKI